jgi:hypothetical protein
VSCRHGVRRHAVGSIAEGEVDVKSASGDVARRDQQGSRLHVDATLAERRHDLRGRARRVEVAADGPLVEVKGTTMSGDIRIVRA